MSATTRHREKRALNAQLTGKSKAFANPSTLSIPISDQVQEAQGSLDAQSLSSKEKDAELSLHSELMAKIGLRNAGTGAVFIGSAAYACYFFAY